MEPVLPEVLAPTQELPSPRELPVPQVPAAAGEPASMPTALQRLREHYALDQSTTSPVTPAEVAHENGHAPTPAEQEQAARGEGAAIAPAPTLPHAPAVVLVAAAAVETWTAEGSHALAAAPLAMGHTDGSVAPLAGAELLAAGPADNQVAPPAPLQSLTSADWADDGFADFSEAGTGWGDSAWTEAVAGLGVPQTGAGVGDQHAGAGWAAPAGSHAPTPLLGAAFAEAKPTGVATGLRTGGDAEEGEASIEPQHPALELLAALPDLSHLLSEDVVALEELRL